MTDDGGQTTEDAESNACSMVCPPSSVFCRPNSDAHRSYPLRPSGPAGTARCRAHGIGRHCQERHSRRPSFLHHLRYRAEGVRLSPRLREKYPEEMTIVLQHQFWDLVVTDDAFEVGLAFGGVAERLLVSVRCDQELLRPLGAVRTAVRAGERGRRQRNRARNARKQNRKQAAGALYNRTSARPARLSRRSSLSPMSRTRPRAAGKSCGSIASGRNKRMLARAAEP